MFSIEGQGAPIVILPGFGLDRGVMSTAFEPVFRGPKAADWKRIYLNLPGCGETPPVEPTSDSVLDAIQESVTVLLGGAPFLLAGHSYGGYLAAGLARRLPDQIRGLLLVCSGVRMDPDRRNLDGVEPSAPEPGWLAGAPDDLHEYFERAIGVQTRSVGRRMSQVFERIGPMDEEYLATLRATGYELSDEDSEQVYDGEVCVLVGRRDRVAGYLDQLWALANYSHGSFAVLAEAGHYLPFEQPELFAIRTLEWLARCEPAAGRVPNRRPGQNARGWDRRPVEPLRTPEPVRPPELKRTPEPPRTPEPLRTPEPAMANDLDDANDAAEPLEPPPPPPQPRPRTLRIIR
jgi:pimeloyl-ACP methyl ester carboxylesterase